MMIFRILFTVISVVFAASTQAAQVSQVEISESAPSQLITLMDQRFEPIYEQQPYQATCSRQVFDHYESFCNTVNDRVCHGGAEICRTESDQVCNSRGCTTIPRRVCSAGPEVCTDVPRRVCDQRAVDRTDYYSCTQYRTVQVGERLVKTFQNNVEVAVDHPELLEGQKLVISLLGREASVTPTLVSAFNSRLLTVESQIISNEDQGASQVLATRILVHVEESLEAIGKISTASIQDLSLRYSGIQFKIAGAAALAKRLIIDVSLTQHRAIIRDKAIIDRTLRSSSLSVVTQGDDVLVTLPLDILGADRLKSKRHFLDISVSLEQPSRTVLNARDLSSLLNKKLTASLSNVVPN